jgi:hypothetical protein
MEARMSSNALVLVLVLVGGSLVAVGCTSAQGPTPSLTQAETPRGCPLGVPGATVVAEDTPEGVALSFTSKDKVGEMRQRANDAAAQYGPGAKMGRGHDGRHGHGGTHGLQLMQAPASHAVASDIEGGARIQFAPADPADKEVLRATLRERAAAMNAAACN